MKYYNLEPSPSSLLESLRDIGYSMETALSDIIDNSITAKAKRINIDFEYDNKEAWILISDDGYGMDHNELLEAMKLGSKNPLKERNSEDLGRFGLGLKTASFSQSRQLTVLSKKNSVISAMEWDLDEISSSSGGWNLKILADDDIEKIAYYFGEINQLKSRVSGTIILWRKLDRIDNFDSEDIKETKFNELMSIARQHVSLTFHRFLDPKENKVSLLKVYFNQDKLSPVDPFCCDQPATVELPEKVIIVNNSKVLVQPYVLPHHSKITPEQYEDNAGKEGFMQNQGFYVYRNKRLIIKSTWFRVIPKSELNKLIRIRVDITNELDSIWKIDVKKSNASPPMSVRNELKNIISTIEYRGRQVIKQKGYKQVCYVQHPFWERTQKSKYFDYSINKNHPMILNISSALKDDIKVQFLNLIDSIGSSFPAEHFYSEYASASDKFKKTTLSNEQIYESLKLLIPLFPHFGYSEMKDFVLGTEPFHSHRDQSLAELDKIFEGK